MKYLFGNKKLKKKYEYEMGQMLSGEKYRIRLIESFADFPDSLHPFRECASLLGASVLPISFSMCERGDKLVGMDTLSYHKSMYDNAKYNWAKKSCINCNISTKEYYTMLKDIQSATLPYGAFTIAFKCHRLNGDSVKSNCSDENILYSPLLYDAIEIESDVLDYFCKMLSSQIQVGNALDIHQMNVYTDNTLRMEDIDNVYPVIKKMMQKYNEYAMEVYHTYKTSSFYQHRCDF